MDQYQVWGTDQDGNPGWVPVSRVSGYWITEDTQPQTISKNCPLFQPSQHSGCDHDWKPYIGFTESYKYCTKCPEKRHLNE